MNPNTKSTPTDKRNSTGAMKPTEPIRTAQDLVNQLLQGKNVLVINYLDTLSVEDRKKTVDEMNKILDTAK